MVYFFLVSCLQENAQLTCNSTNRTCKNQSSAEFQESQHFRFWNRKKNHHKIKENSTFSFGKRQKFIKHCLRKRLSICSKEQELQQNIVIPFPFLSFYTFISNPNKSLSFILFSQELTKHCQILRQGVFSAPALPHFF